MKMYCNWFQRFCAKVKNECVVAFKKTNLRIKKEGVEEFE
jgi:hypothetical protein